MKSFSVSLLFFCFLLAGCDAINQTVQLLTQTVNPTQTETALGLKQALEFGTTSGSDRLSATDGFFANAAIKILFPEEAQKVERILRNVSLNELADNVMFFGD